MGSLTVDDAARSSWLTPVEQRPAPLPRMAALPPGVRIMGRDPPTPRIEIPKATEPPSEAEARQTLMERQREKHDADAALAAAQAAYQRATKHLADAIDAVASYDNLDAEIVEATAAALRSGDGRPRIEASDELRGRIAARGEAQAGLSAARAAEQQLAAEQAQARTVATDAATAHEFAIRDVLAVEANKLAERYLEVLSDAHAFAATAAGLWDAVADANGLVRGSFGPAARPGGCDDMRRQPEICSLAMAGGGGCAASRCRCRGHDRAVADARAGAGAADHEGLSMPVVTLVKPMRLNLAGGVGQLQYGIGQYMFDTGDAYDRYVVAHTANGQPEFDSVKITDPGPPVVIISTHPS